MCMNMKMQANAFAAFGALSNYGFGAQHEAFAEQVFYWVWFYQLISFAFMLLELDIIVNASWAFLYSIKWLRILLVWQMMEEIFLHLSGPSPALPAMVQILVDFASADG